jgi:hypothetical protein
MGQIRGSFDFGFVALPVLERHPRPDVNRPQPHVDDVFRGLIPVPLEVEVVEVVARLREESIPRPAHGDPKMGERSLVASDKC